MSYVSFLWKSSNDHGIHSPFVFSFISNTFYNGSPLRELRSGKISGPLHLRTLRVLYKIIVNRKAFKILVLGEQAREITEQLRAAAEITKSQLWFFFTFGYRARRCRPGYYYRSINSRNTGAVGAHKN